MNSDYIHTDDSEKLEFVDLDRVRGYIRSLRVPNVDKTIENITCVAVLMSALFYSQNHILDILHELNYNSGGYSEEISLLVLSQTTIKDILRILAKYSNSSPIPTSLNDSSRSVRIIISNMDPLLHSLGVENRNERRARLNPEALIIEISQLKDGVNDIRERLIELYKQLVPDSDEAPSLNQLTDGFLDLFKHFGLEVNDGDADVDISVYPEHDSQSSDGVKFRFRDLYAGDDSEKVIEHTSQPNSSIEPASNPPSNPPSDPASDSASVSDISEVPAPAADRTDTVIDLDTPTGNIDPETGNNEAIIGHTDTVTSRTENSVDPDTVVIHSDSDIPETRHNPSNDVLEPVSSHSSDGNEDANDIENDDASLDVNGDISVDVNEPVDVNEGDEINWEQYPNTPVSDYIEDDEPEPNESTVYERPNPKKRRLEETLSPLPRFEKPMKDPVKNVKGLKFPYAKYKWPRRRQALINPSKLFSQSPKCCQKIVRMYRDEIELNGLFVHDINRFLVQRNADYIEINRIFSMFMNSNSELQKSRLEAGNLTTQLELSNQQLETEKKASSKLQKDSEPLRDEIEKQKTELNELQTGYNELKQSKEALESRNQGLVYINKQLVSDKSAALDKNIKLTVDLNNQSNALKDLTTKLEAANNELGQYKNQQAILDNLRTENEELHSKNAELKSELDTRVSEFDQLHKTHSMASSFPNKVISNSHNQILLQEKDLVIAKLSKDYNEKVREWNEQQNELVNCKSELNVQKETVKQLSQRLESGQSTLNIQKSRQADLETKIRELSGAISARDEQMNSFSETMQLKDAEAANMYSELVQLRLNLQETEKERARLGEISANYERDWSVWSQMDTDYKYKVQNYEQQLFSLQQEHATLKDQCKQVDLRCTEAEMRLAEAEKRYNDLETRNAKTEKEFRNLETTYTELKTKHSDLETKCNVMEKQSTEINSQFKEAERQYNDMVREYKNMEIKCKSMEKEYTNADSKFKEMERQRNEMEIRYNSLQSRYSDAEKQFNETKSKLNETQKELFRLQSAYNLQTENDRKVGVELQTLQNEYKEQIRLLETKDADIVQLRTSLSDIESKQRLLTASLDRAVEERGNASRGCQFMSSCIARLLTMMQYVELDPVINTHINELFALFRNFDGDFDKDRIEMYLASIMDHLEDVDDSPSPEDIAERIDSLISKLSFPPNPSPS